MLRYGIRASTLGFVILSFVSFANCFLSHLTIAGVNTILGSRKRYQSAWCCKALVGRWDVIRLEAKDVRNGEYVGVKYSALANEGVLEL